MAQDQSFKVVYQNDDGYVGGSRPHSFNIHSSELDSDMDETELRDYFWESVESDFLQRNMNLHSDQEEGFIAWAKNRAAETKAKDI